MEASQRLYAMFFVEDLIKYFFSRCHISWKLVRPLPILEIYYTTPDSLKFNDRFARAVEVASLVYYQKCDTECTEIWNAYENAPESSRQKVLSERFASLAIKLGSSSCTFFMFLVVVLEISRRLYMSNEDQRISEVVFSAVEYLTKLSAYDARGMFSAMRDFSSNFLETYDHKDVLENISVVTSTLKSLEEMVENADSSKS